MNISVNDTLRVDGSDYHVTGKITYRNKADGAVWDEYRLIPFYGGNEKWLSIDEQYGEYSISEATSDRGIGTYHRVDKGTQVVVSKCGNVDVDIGDTATFAEYEDSTEEKTLSIETWEDGTEYSRGYYLDADEIQVISGANSYQQSGGSAFVSNAGRSYSSGGRTQISPASLIAVIIIFFGGPLMTIIAGFMGSSVPKIADYMKKTSSYSYVTSITGSEKEKADVYKSTMTVDATVKDIIDAIDGKTENVQQNTDDGDTSVGILTKKEYCLVYTSEDNDVLVQVSSRKYAYYNDTSPYRSTRHTHRYYRRFYRSMGYSYDSSSYSGGYSPYSSYDDTTLSKNSADTYSTYSGSVRQASISSRTSSGGGTSSGK